MTDGNVLIVGVGGQGTLLASKIIGQAALLAGQDVKQSEVHGMAQRGGSVVTHVRYGTLVHSPLIEKKQADVILAFEKLEALHYADYLKPGGRLIVNDQQIAPVPVLMGNAVYPEQIYPTLASFGIALTVVNALALAKAMGNVQIINVILLGILAQSSVFDPALWEQAIDMSVPAKVRDINLQAFSCGYHLTAQ